MELDEWPPELRANVISIINPEYRQFVLLAKPGLERSIGITLVHLLWLEILDQIEIARHKEPTADPFSDPLLQKPVSRFESRRPMIEHYLRLVHAKIKVSDFLLRLEKFKTKLQSKNELPIHSSRPNLSVLPRRPREYGENDFC